MFSLSEKDVPYDTVLIDLRNKPDWYKEMVPTALTPAARINGELVWESMEILQVRSTPTEPRLLRLHEHSRHADAVTICS